MFGIFYGLISLIGTGISGLNAFIEDSQAKSRGLKNLEEGDNDSHTYFDRKGTERNLSDNRIVEETIFHERDLGKHGYLHGSFPGCIEGDNILIDSINHTFVRNLSQIKREKLVQEEDTNGKTVVDAHIRDLVGPYKFLDNKKGSRYTDLKTKELYLCRKFPIAIHKKGYQLVEYKECVYYISEKTGLIVREADCQKEYEEYCQRIKWLNKIPSTKEKEDFIEEFNRLQMEGGWMKLKHKEYSDQKEYAEARLTKFNQYIYRNNPDAYFFCNEFDYFDRVIEII